MKAAEHLRAVLKAAEQYGAILRVLRIAEEYRDDRGRAEDCGVLRDG